MRKTHAFTLVELIISIMISGIILVFLFSIVGNIVRDIQNSISTSETIAQLWDFTGKMNNFKVEFLSGGLLVDNLAGSGSDIFMMSDLSEQSGLVFALLDADNLKPVTTFSADFVTRKILGYRQLSGIEITQLQTDFSKIYSYKFQKENTLPSVVMKDFQIELFQSGAIINMALDVNVWYKSDSETQRYSEIGNSEIEIYNFSF